LSDRANLKGVGGYKTSIIATATERLIMLKQALSLLILSTVVAVLANVVSPHRLDFVGKWRDLSSGDGPIIPPAAAKGDPPFIEINTAQMEYTTGGVLFIDARDPVEYNCGTIPGAINIPFEYLPEEDDMKPYLDSALGGIPPDRHIITFCSGEECDLSLQLGRLLRDYGYSNISIFFGGAREWEKFGLEVQRRDTCDE